MKSSIKSSMKLPVELPVLAKPLNERPEASFTLSSEYYLSEEIYELEKRAIFYKSWQYVAPLTRFEAIGDYVTLRICDESIFVIRSADGKLRAFYNVCRHRAHELLSGSGNKPKAIVCPYHAWTYKTDGELVNAPLSSGRPGFKYIGIWFNRGAAGGRFAAVCLLIWMIPSRVACQSIAADIGGGYQKTHTQLG